MQTMKEKILNFLSSRHAGLCDDCISDLLSIFPRATVNLVCNSLSRKKLISRSKEQCQGCKRNKLVNSIAEGKALAISKQSGVPKEKDEASIGRLWYWEGNLQARLVTWLASEGYKIRSVADTAARSRGVDIIAEDSNGEPLWISVKGYPNTTQHAQARHYFSGAIFDLILYRGQSSSVHLAIGLPAGFSTYENLAQKVQWMKKTLLAFDIYWVSETGHVRKE